MNQKFTFILITLLMAFFSKVGFGQTTYTVGASGQDFTTIQEAIDNASVVDGDIISIVDAIHTEFGIQVTKSLTFKGQGAENTIVQAAQTMNLATDRVFTLINSVSVFIEDMTIRHGNSSGFGGGIQNHGMLEINRCTIADNKVSTEDWADEGGGGIYNSGKLTVKFSEISGNYSGWHGAGIWMTGGDAELYIENCIFKNNEANKSGGGFGVYEGNNIEVKNTLIHNNTSGLKGGGIHIGGNYYDKATLNSVTITGNSTVDYGGGIYVDYANLYVVNTIIAGNSCSDNNNYSDIAIWGSEYSLGHNIIGIDDGDFNEIETDFEGTPSEPFDPEFNEEYVPLLTSSIINYGPSNFASLNLENVDVYGNPRVYDGDIDIIDIGAVEFQGEPLPTYLISVPETSVNFGDAPAGSNTYYGINLENTGQADLTIDSIFASGGFEIYMNSKSAIDTALYGKTIAAHDIEKLFISINHDTDSLFTGDIVIYSNATNKPEVTVSVTANILSGQDYFTGDIITNTTWCQDTVHIGGDIKVDKDATLSICAGTVIDFLGDYKLTVNGNLQVNGTVDDTVIFTNRTGDWAGIRFEGIEHTNEIVSTISYARIEKANANGNDEYDKGGGIYLDYTASVQIENSEIINNNAHHFGGGVYNGGNLEITTSLISGNSTSYSSSNYGGGGIANAGTLRILNSGIHNNSSAYHGGGILNVDDNAMLYLENDSITNNTASRAGGGIGNSYVNQVDIINCLIANNTATSRKGGGIQNGDNSTGTINITSSTIFGNMASGSYYGGGIQNEKGTFNIINTIIAGNSAGSYDDVYNTGTLNSLGYNLIGNEDGYSFPAADGDLIGTSSNPYDAMLKADYLLQDSSLAINHGIADTTGLNIPALDIKGNSRIYDGNTDVIDIGAFEFQNNPSINYSLNINQDGLDFGFVKVDSSKYVEVELINTGFGIIEIDSIIAPDGYEVSVSGSEFNDTLTDIAITAYNQSTMEVKFIPSSTATFSGNIEIQSNDTDEPQQTISVTGDGTDDFILSGDITENTSFCVDTLKVIDDVTIHDGITLEICPGTVIEFQGNYTLNVQGQLLAEGTLTDTIVFTYLNGADTWGGIRFDNTPSGNSFSKISYSIIEYGENNRGGAIYIDNYHKLGFNNNIVRNNTAGDYGGGIYNNGTLTIEECIIDNNTADCAWGEGGGGIANGGSLTIINSVISNNSSSWHGGGIMNISGDASLTVLNSKIIDNTADQGGGGLGNYYASSIHIQNTLIAGNSTNWSKGGGIHAGSNFNGTVNIENSTITGNHSGYNGGGVFNEAATFYFSNTIISGNSGDGNHDDLYINGTINSEGYNFIGNTGAYDWKLSEGDIIGTSDNVRDAWLDSDYMPTDSSLVVNMGNPVGDYPETDLGGNTRIYEGRIDIGAYELQSGKVLTNLLMDVDTLDINFDYQQVGEASYAVKRNLSFVSGNGNITISSISAPSGYTLSISEDSSFTNTLSGLELLFNDEMNLYVRMEPGAEQEYTGSILINSNAEPSVIEIPVSGFGVNDITPSFSFINAAPAIDGLVDDLWNSISHERLNLAGQGDNSRHDLNANFRGVWDADSLYLLVKITNDTLYSGNTDSSLNDNLELFLDFNNSKGESYDSDDYMIRFSYGTETAAFVVGDAFDINFVQYSPDAGTLIYEIAIPWDVATEVTPAEGVEMGIELNINDNDGAGIEDQVTWYSNSENKSSEPSVFGTIILLDENGVDTQAPVFELSYNESDFTVACEDSVYIPFTITNNGNGRGLEYTLFNGIYDFTSEQHFSGDGATTWHSFTGLSSYSRSLQLVIYIEGDFGNSSEYATLEIEGMDYGQIEKGGEDFNGGDGDPFTSTYTFGKSEIQDWLSDGQLDISITNSSGVGDWAGALHQVQLLIDKGPGNQGEINQGGSLNIEIPVEVGSFPEGITEDLIIISSNDPSNPSDTILFTINKQGYPILETTQTQFDFGEVKANHYGKETLFITNTGCDTLFVDSITSSHEYFFVESGNFVIEPTETVEAYVYFLPTDIGEFNEFMTIYSNDENKTINVKGVTADTIAPQVTAAYVSNDNPGILVVEFDEEIQASGYNGFSVSGISASITGYTSNSNIIELELSGDVIFGDVLSLDYEEDSLNVKDIATLENTLLSFTGLLVANNVEYVDDVPPSIISAKVENENPDQVILVFDEAVTISSKNNFTVNGTTGNIEYYDQLGDETIVLVLENNVLYGEVLTLDYVSGSGHVEDNAENELEEIEGLTILNYVEYVDIFAPEFVSAVVEDANPDQIVITFDEPVTTSDETGFSIIGTSGSIIGVTGSGTSTLTFTLDADVAFGENITITYSSGNVTDTAASPNNLLDFGPETAVNNVLYSGGGGSDPIVIGLSVEDANPNQIIVAFDEDVTLTNETGFSVSGITAGITGVTGSGNDTLIFTLDVSVVYGDIVLLSYNATGDVQDGDTNPLAAFSNYNVVNNVAYIDLTAPILSSAKVENATPTVVNLVFDENVVFTDASGFTINGTSGSITGATGSGTNTMLILLDAAVVYGESLTVDYDQPSGNVTDEATNDLTSFTGVVAVNYVEYVDETKPEIIAAVVENDSPFEVVVTFTEEVTYDDFTGLTVNGSLGSIISISGDGTDVITLTLDEEIVYGDVVSLDYSGGNITDLATLPNSLDNFTGITVINNVEAETINPTIVSAVIEHTSQDDIVVNFDEMVYITDVSGFSISGTSASISNVDGSGTTVLTFTLDANALYSDILTLSYDGLGNTEDRVGNILMPVDFSVINNILNDDASLSDLKVDDETVSGFDSGTTTYTVELPYGTTTVPAVTATPTDANAEVVITDATVLPGITTATVTAEDGTTEQVYTINLTVAPNDDATLADLKVDGTIITGFNAVTLTYEVELPAGTTVVPTVMATATDVNASIMITDATALPGTTTVTVTAEDGSTELVYSINFTVAVGINDLTSEFGVSIYPNPSNGLFYLEIMDLTNESIDIEILSAEGKVVYKDQFIYNDREKLDISGLPTGMYIIKIVNDKKVTINQIIIK